MSSLVHGPGNHEGQQAEPPARPASAWDVLADQVPTMPDPQSRRVAMLVLHLVGSWRLEDIGKLFKLHKGHVCREIDRARLELAPKLSEAGVDVARGRPSARKAATARINVWMTHAERQRIAELAREWGCSESMAVRRLMPQPELDNALQTA